MTIKLLSNFCRNTTDTSWMLAKLEAHSNYENLRISLAVPGICACTGFTSKALAQHLASCHRVLGCSRPGRPGRTRPCKGGVWAGRLERRTPRGSCVGLFRLGSLTCRSSLASAGVSCCRTSPRQRLRSTWRALMWPWPPSCSTTTGWRRRYALTGIFRFFMQRRAWAVGTHWGHWMNRGSSFNQTSVSP